MSILSGSLSRLMANRSGAAAVEYCIVIGAIAVAVAGAFQVIGVEVSDMIEPIIAKIG